jgi:hypothetical protein
MAERLPKAGRVYRYKKLLFWAQGGTICIEDTTDGGFDVVTAAEFAARVIAVRGVLEADAHKYADERNEDWNFVVNGAAAVKEARRKQGDPFDPRVLDQLLRARRRSFIFTGQGNYSVSFADAPVIMERPGAPGGLVVSDQDSRPDYQIVPPTGGGGRAVILHTVSQDCAPDQAAQLPPIPTKDGQRRR